MNAQGFSVRTNGIFGFIFLLLVLVGLFFVAKSLFTVLLWLSPVLLVAALVVNHRTVINYLKFIVSLLGRSPLAGIIAIILSILGFPVLSGVLLGKAFFDRKVRRLRQAHQAQEAGEFVEYEEVRKPARKDDLELPPMEKQQPEKKDNRYENLF